MSDQNDSNQWQPRDWEPRDYESSLSNSSLDDNPQSPYAARSNDPGEISESPNPFSREGSSPADALGADGAAVASSAPSAPVAGEEWPGYPPQGPASDPYSGAGAPQQQPYPNQQNPPYGANPYQANPYQANPYQANPYDVNPYQANPYDVNPYQANPYQANMGAYSPYGVVAQQHPQATASMILGIVGLVVCPFVGIGGLVLGRKVRKAIDTEPQRYTGRGMATAGFVLGILSVIYASVYVLVIVVGLSGGFDY